MKRVTGVDCITLLQMDGSSYQSCEDAQQETNCETQGDYVCDTEPTAAAGGCTNDCGNDTENIMSYHPGT